MYHLLNLGTLTKFHFSCGGRRIVESILNKLSLKSLSDINRDGSCPVKMDRRLVAKSCKVKEGVFALQSENKNI